MLQHIPNDEFWQVKRTLTTILCSVCREQWALCRDPVIWNAACGESRCTVGEGREVCGCAWVWRSLCECVLSLASQRQFPLQTRAALWDRLHNKRLHRPLLCYGNYKTLRHLLLFSCTRQIVMCVFSVCHFDIQKKVKIPFGVDNRWPPRLSREKRQTKR